MKKTIKFILCLLISAFMISVLFSCVNVNKKQIDETEDVIETNATSSETGEKTFETVDGSETLPNDEGGTLPDDESGALPNDESETLPNGDEQIEAPESEEETTLKQEDNPIDFAEETEAQQDPLPQTTGEKLSEGGSEITIDD